MVQAVLLDWRGTLVHDPPDEWWVSCALERAGRAVDDGEVARLCDALGRAAQHPDVIEGEKTCDCAPELHRAWSMGWFARGGLDDELAEALYALDFLPESHPFYPDVGPVLSALHERNIRVAVVSNIHLDLRPEFGAAGLDDFIDAYVFSFEHGVQKPDPAMFELALDALGVEPGDALMVGDQPSLDAGAVKAGVLTLLLPRAPSAEHPVGLERILALVN